MSCQTITTMLTLISAIHLPYPESRLIGQLNNVYSFDQNIFLLNSTADVNRFVGTNGTDGTPKTIHIYVSGADGNITILKAITKITSKNTFLIVDSEKPTLDLLLLVKQIQRLEKRMKIGMFFSHVISTDDLHDVFQWCWQNGIVKGFAAFCSSNCGVLQGNGAGPLLNIFTFLPFRKLSVINVTASSTFDNFFLKQNANFQQHPIRMLTEKIVPIRNYEAQAWKNILKVLNASVITVYDNAAKDIDELFCKDTFDCTIHSHVFEDNYLLKKYGSYPLGFVEVLFVVPEAQPYPEFTAYLQTLMSDNFCIYSLVAVLSVIFILTISRYVEQKKIAFFQSVADVVNLIMNDNGGIKYQKLSHPEGFLIVPLTFVGLIVVNGVISTLKSFLTQPVMQPQIDTLEDIYNSPYPILVSPEWLEFVHNMLTEQSTHGDWSNKIRVSELREQKREIEALNTSISFPMLRSEAKLLVDSQRRSNLRGYHIPTQVSLVISLLTLAINDNFPFMERLNEIIHWMQNGGLYEKWAVEYRWQFNVTELGKTTDVDTFPIPTFIAYGWALGGIVFVVEIVWKQLSSRKCRQRKIM